MQIYSDDDTYVRNTLDGLRKRARLDIFALYLQHEGRTNIYQNLGIDAKTGCVIVVRPDSYVSLIIKLEDHVSIGQ